MSRIKDCLIEHLHVSASNPETLREIEAISDIRKYNANDIIYREHENSQCLFIVISGQIDVQYLLKNGRRKTLDTCIKGDHLVWSALVEPHETNSIGICRAESELLAIDGRKLLAICSRDTEFGFKMMGYIASVIRRRLQASRKQMSMEPF